MRLAFLVVLVFFLCVGLASAQSQPAQQYNKIFLNPFYRMSLNANTNYTYTLQVNPPDGMSRTMSSIVSFNAQINGQTQNFTLLVNGQPCNNPDYYIATAFSTTGTSQVYFDCSNRIGQIGNYTLVLRSAVNAGTVQGWLDLTYMNNPKGSASVSGTEYRAGDQATIFVQLKDAQGQAVTNGSCYVDIYYPRNTTGGHPYTIIDAPMVNAGQGDGFHYYDLTAPDVPGVYMVSAKCAYAFNWQWLYPASELIYSPARTPISGTLWSGNMITLNTPEDSGYDQCQQTGSGTCQANYTFNLNQYGGYVNITNINLYYLGESTRANTLTLAYWNGTTFVDLPNTLLFVATGSTTAPSGVDQLLTNSVPVAANRNGTITIRVTVPTTSTFALYNNWFSIAILTSYGSIQEVKGNSEMHINNWTFGNVTSESLQGIASAVWNFTNRSASGDMLFVGGNEYMAGEMGAISVRITSGSANNPVDGANCTVTALYPNLTAFIANGTMIQPGLAGVYTYNFTVPSLFGVYTYAVDCAKTGQKYYLLDTFHVAPITNITRAIQNDTIAIRNQTSLISQIWTWVQGIFNWVQTDQDANATTSAPVQVQSVAFLDSEYYADAPAAVVAQVLIDGVGVTGAGCTLNVYYPNMTKQLNSVTMTWIGDDGLYNYTWTPPTYGSYPAKVNCSGGGLRGQLSATGSLGVSAPSNGVMMQMVS